MYKPKPLPPLAFRQRDDLAFHRALQQAAKGYLQEKGDHRFADSWVYLKSLTLILVCLGSYGLMLSSQGGMLFLWVIRCLFSLPYCWRLTWCTMLLITPFFGEGRLIG